MPVLSIILNRVNFSDLKYVIEPAKVTLRELPSYTARLYKRLWISLIIAFSIFLFVKLITSVKKKASKDEREAVEAEEAAEAAEIPAPSKEALLLEEIRDLLKQNNTNQGPTRPQGPTMGSGQENEPGGRFFRLKKS